MTTFPRLPGRLGAFLLFFSLSLCGESPGADWPQFLGPERNNTSAETGLALKWPKEGPRVLWDREVGDGFSGPVIASDRLILFHRVGDQEVVECLDAATGKQHWKYAYDTRYRDDFGKGDGPRSTPLLAGSRVFTLGAEGRLHCLELETGKKVWQRSLSTEYQVEKGFFGVATSPILEGDAVIVNVGGKDAGIVAFHKDTGKEVWKATDHEASYASPVAATLDGTRHVFFFTRDGLVSLDPASGAVRFSERWRSRMNASVNAATPVVVDGHVFLSACYGTGAVLFKVRKDGVEAVWKSDRVLSNHYDTSVYHKGYLYGMDGRQETGAEFRCVEAKSGKVRWAVENFGCGSVVLADGHLIVLSERGDLLCVEANSDAYKERARATVLGKSCRAAIALANGRLYARDGRKLVCWDLKK
jgi:outer membrane protein assembly factor BamB